MTEPTQAEALAEIRRYCDLYPFVAPEVPAMGIIRRAASMWEVAAVLAALDEVLAVELPEVAG